MLGTPSGSMSDWHRLERLFHPNTTPSSRLGGLEDPPQRLGLSAMDALGIDAQQDPNAVSGPLATCTGSPVVLNQVETAAAVTSAEVVYDPVSARSWLDSMR